MTISAACLTLSSLSVCKILLTQLSTYDKMRKPFYMLNCASGQSVVSMRKMVMRICQSTYKRSIHATKFKGGRNSTLQPLGEGKYFQAHEQHSTLPDNLNYLDHKFITLTSDVQHNIGHFCLRIALHKWWIALYLHFMQSIHTVWSMKLLHKSEFALHKTWISPPNPHPITYCTS